VKVDVKKTAALDDADARPETGIGHASGARWQVHSFRAGETFPSAAPDGVIEHDVDWLIAQCDSPAKAVVVLADAGGGAVPLFVHDGQVDFNFGELTLAYAKVRRHVLVGNFPGRSVADWAAAFDALYRALEPKAAVFLLGVVRGESLDQAIAGGALAQRFRIAAHGADYTRRLCALGSSLDDYLASLPAKSRQDLKRSLRRFEGNFAGRFALSTYGSVEEVRRFLNAVRPVSERTYQARQLSLGITPEGHIGTKVLEGARRGYARCYLLTVDGQPVAWRIGFVYAGVYCSHHVGYDPDFEKWHPGVVLHLHTVRDLSENVAAVDTLDMLYGDNDFKRKTSNLARVERNYYMFPRTARGTAVYLALKSCNGLSESLGRTIDRIGLKARLKRWIRRR
jgi:hypothetical protein